MKESEYKLRKKIKELEERCARAENHLYSYRAVMLRLYSWLAGFAKTGNEIPRAAYGLELMKELFK